jgi:hypothetical protein
LNYKPVNAKEYILNRAENEQIVILNEAHHNPLHRVFTASLLEELYRQGFRYFGAETLNYVDSTLNQRKYPILHSGYYTREPQYGNLVREALRLGFQVFAYEATTPEEFANGKSREIAQARNIEKILKKDSNAKVLIHCGYAHVQEVPLNNSWEKAMAGRVKEFTGIDPFTTDQEIWTEKSEPSKENPLYRMINVKQPSVFLNSKGEAFSTTANATALTDIRVAHPRTTFRYGRPTWLLREGKWKPYFLKKEQLTLTFPCLVLAYKEGEQVVVEKTLQQAIPVDVVELKKPGEEKALILPKGNYRIIVINEQGSKKSFFVRHVK